jgi:hypothetical protein
MELDLLKADEVRKILRCSLPHVYKLADTGALRCVRISTTSETNKNPKKRQNLIRFKRSDVFQFIESNYK